MTNLVEEALSDAPRVREVVHGAVVAARARAASGFSEEAVGAGERSAMTHSWVITGGPGSGRLQVARAFAAGLECTDPETPGCGRCEACRAVMNGSHTDVQEFRTRKYSIAVSVAREDIVPAVSQLPTVGRWRVVIIDNADRLTGQAADALLKTVEEPSKQSVVLFCAPSVDPEDFSVTLRSRCRHISVPPPSVERIVRLLVREEGATEHDAALAAQASLRHIGRARLLVTDEGMQRRRARVLRLAELVNHGDVAFREISVLVKATKKESEELHAEEEAEEAETLRRSFGAGGRGKGVAKLAREAERAVKSLEEEQKRRHKRIHRDLIDLCLVDLSGLYRDAFLRAVDAPGDPVHPDFAELAGEIAGQVGAAGLADCLEAIGQCREHLKQNVWPQIALDGLMGKLRMAHGVR